jgi:hypothetical protein
VWIADDEVANLVEHHQTHTPKGDDRFSLDEPSGDPKDRSPAQDRE